MCDIDARAIVAARRLQTLLGILFLLAASSALAEAAQPAKSINVSLSHSRARRGDRIEVRVEAAEGSSPSGEHVQAIVLRPSMGTQILPLTTSPGRPGVYRADITLGDEAAEGFYVIHAWTGERENPAAVGKAVFLLGKLVNDFFMAAYVDRDQPAADVDAYMRDFRALGGNFLVVHNIITPEKAFYPSKICRTDVARGSGDDIVELALDRADREGYAVLLSVSWDMTRQSHFRDRMKEIKAISDELYGLYRHHPSLAGFYSYQEGSGTYYAPFVSEFSQHIKGLHQNLLTACAPHIDDPLLAGYLSTISELDVIIYQAGVMASYRPDNRKKYPPGRVRDFCSLGTGAKRLQGKIAIPHVEVFAYLDKRPYPEIPAASYEDIYRQILSAATVTEADGISLFSYHAHVYLLLKKHRQVARSRAAVADGLRAFRLISAQVSGAPNPVAIYFPYSDWIVERWANYFLPALDAFRLLGIPVDVLPYAPPLRESVYPYYPFHMNEEVLARLLKERTVLVLPNVSGFQQTDSDLIRAFVEGGGVIVAFGPQIPMGRSYERRDLFGGEELSQKTRASITVREALGSRAPAGTRSSLDAAPLPSWTGSGARVIAAFEDGSAAVLMNRYGKGLVVTITPDASTMARHAPDLVRDVIEHAVRFAGGALPVDVIGANENIDVAVGRTSDGLRIAIVNHGPAVLEITIRPSREYSTGTQRWRDMVSGEDTGSGGRSFSLRVPGNGFRAIESARK